MVTKQIGAMTFDTMQGRPIEPAVALETIDVPGEDGQSFRDLGDKGPVATLSTTKFVATAAAASTEAADCRLLIGLTVTVYDSDGTQFDLCHVVDVRPAYRTVIHDATVKKLVATKWMVQMQP